MVGANVIATQCQGSSTSLPAVGQNVTNRRAFYVVLLSVDYEQHRTKMTAK